MSNIGNLSKLIYCGCKLSNTSTCGNMATQKVSLKKRGSDSDMMGVTYYGYRCENHKNTGTTGMKIIKSELFDQSEEIEMTNKFLTGLIGKKIVSSMHTARSLDVKFLKNNGGVMCFQPMSKKWKFVYYSQIETVL